MPKHDLETVTEVSTAHKISVGLVVATATLVVLSAIVAAAYTWSINLQPSVTAPEDQAVRQTTSNPVIEIKNDRSFTTP